MGKTAQMWRNRLVATVVVLAGAAAVTACSAPVELGDGAATTVVAATAAPTPTDPAEPTVGPIPHVPVDPGTDPAIVLTDPDPAAVDDALAELEARRGDDQVVVVTDFDGCLLLEAKAVPQPGRVLVRVTWEDVECVRAVDYRALFLVERQGVNNHGRWDYSSTPPVVTEFD